MSPIRTLGAGYGPRGAEDVFPDPDAATLASGLRPALDVLVGRRVTVLTGAGVSTDSGIPDYRGPDSLPREPMTYQEFMASAANRSRYWARNQVGWHHLELSAPNATHRSLARLEAAGRVNGVITQNIDRLHQRAGSFAVVDLHGRYDQVLCTSCRSLIPRGIWGRMLDELNPEVARRSQDPNEIEFAPDADAEIQTDGEYLVPDCPVCGGIVKPHVVFFGEQAQADDVARATAAVDVAEAVLVLGSSLTVHSGRRFVRRAVRSNKPVVIVNHGRTRSDADAAVKIDSGVAQFLEQAEPSWIRG
ncbi:NAD-dependent deacetylase [Kocuria sp. JC486]|uniref:protein acetyllysine N-acetyltransferase n=1 Tax=Kocuria soli TaxID=2485125 RepID=A0A3N3ZP69_9MICC|nr:Sir2 family NAD-dependent protein deacetylase [Kocuria soli]NHU85746.1 NAD-dependent deacetylase [Kocuria sp. JC486]ROZ61848.1 NAD-dependent deacetylase [Kocuria soli]